MVYIHSPVGNNLDTIPGTNGARRGRIAIGLGRKRRYENVYFCPSCGRDMIYLKQVPCLFCTGCSFTQHMDNVKRGRDKPAFEVTNNSIAYVGNPTNSPRKVWVRNNGDPRNYSRFNKESMLNNNSSNNNYNNSAADEEARKYATSTSSRIVDYIEHIYQV
jgi:hypothetical protein